MNKAEFIAKLRAKLSRLPAPELDERIAFYSEMIDDRIEEGLSEKEAVAAIGTVDEVYSQIITDTPLITLAKEKLLPKRKLRPWEIILLTLGAPLWIILALAAIVIGVSIYAVIWSISISLWAVELTFIVCSVGSIIVSITLLVAGNTLSSIAVIGAGIALAGLSVFMFYGCKLATIGTIKLTKKIPLLIKKCFVGKEEI